MRQGNRGRFNDRFELRNIFEGMQEDLQEFVGQTVLWYRFDRENSEVDPIYDVGAETGGRVYFPPTTLPVIAVDLEEGVEVNSGQGSYTTDICHLVVSYDQAERNGLRKMKTNWRMYYGDRFVYLDVVFQVRNIQIRGPVRDQYEVLGIDGWQVNPEELINDPQFAKYAGPGDPSTVPVAEEHLGVTAATEEEPSRSLETGEVVETVEAPEVHDHAVGSAGDDIYGGPAT